ncbi:MAG: hypothetical protein H6Q21_905 [Bacteroidetes bacterium]|nr:hypothetical protein [Bacteroidota bacterium]
MEKNHNLIGYICKHLGILHFIVLFDIFERH